MELVEMLKQKIQIVHEIQIKRRMIELAKQTIPHLDGITTMFSVRNIIPIPQAAAAKLSGQS